MFFRKKVKKGANRMDKIVTGVIIGTAVASIVGLSKTKKGQEVKQEIKEKSTGFFGKVKKMYGKSMIFFLKFFNKKK